MMGETGSEPSMEEILSSIKRIIAEEGEGVPARQRRLQRTTPPPAIEHDDDHVLELRDPIPPIAPEPELERAVKPVSASWPAAPAGVPVPVTEPTAAPATVDPTPSAALPSPPSPPAAPPAAAPTQPIVSQQTAEASRGALDMLSRMIVKPEADSGGTLEGLVREMLRPILRDWLDANLPALVETMVAREIERITGQQG